MVHIVFIFSFAEESHSRMNYYRVNLRLNVGWIHLGVKFPKGELFSEWIILGMSYPIDYGYPIVNCGYPTAYGMNFSRRWKFLQDIEEFFGEKSVKVWIICKPFDYDSWIQIWCSNLFNFESDFDSKIRKIFKSSMLIMASIELCCLCFVEHLSFIKTKTKHTSVIVEDTGLTL